jgi:hypothetical protein
LGRYVFFFDCCQIALKSSPFLNLADDELVIRGSNGENQSIDAVNLDFGHDAGTQSDDPEYVPSADNECTVSLSIPNDQNC